MKLIAIATILAATSLATTSMAAAQSLAGVSDEETVIRSGVIEDFQRGNGDVIFVRDRENKWYRVQLNQNCIAGQSVGAAALFQPRDQSGHINTMTQVGFTEHGIICNIDSIRRSSAPPQVDSRSPVTLD